MTFFIHQPQKNQNQGKWFPVISWALVLALFFGTAGWQAAEGQEPPLPSFGSGLIIVRLYTDYFCPPCRDMEPSVEPILLELVKNGVIHLTFVDVPTGPHTELYARYFLYAQAEKRDIDSVVHARRVLFEAAEKRLVDKNQLVNLLDGKKIGLKAVDLAPALNLWNRLLQEDEIRSTPSCVIIHGDKKKTHVGSLEVIKVLEILRDNFGRGPAGPSGTPSPAKKGE